jgi:Kef-type K+ transport system membrane component KefB
MGSEWVSFVIVAGIQIDLGILFGHVSDVLEVLLVLAALLIARGIPALLYRGTMSGRETAAAALLQATSLSFIIVAVAVGQNVGVITEETAGVLVIAGLLSVMLFPASALRLLAADSRPKRHVGARP